MVLAKQVNCVHLVPTWRRRLYNVLRIRFYSVLRMGFIRIRIRFHSVLRMRNLLNFEF
jgi:hypothetical protein